MVVLPQERPYRILIVHERFFDASRGREPAQALLRYGPKGTARNRFVHRWKARQIPGGGEGIGLGICYTCWDEVYRKLQAVNIVDLRKKRHFLAESIAPDVDLF